MVLRLCVLAGTALAAIGLPASQAPVELLRIEGVREFPEATEPGAIQYACAQTTESLRGFFTQSGLTFHDKLVRPYQGRPTCHVHFEPSAPGFRASPEDRPIRALYGAVDPMRFIAARAPTGESLDVIQLVLAKITRPLRFELRVNERFDKSYWPAALQRHFDGTLHEIGVLPTPGAGTHPWAQDYIKSGSVDGELKILVPRRIFEGRREDGELHRPMLEGLQGEGFIRSKLSWEGGDLLFAKDPRDPSRLLMVYGNAALQYWGADLPREDYDYILATEFGADLTLPLLGAAAHIDFLTSFLPSAGGKPVALVSRAVSQNGAVLEGALTELELLYGPDPPPGLARLRTLLRELDASLNPDPTTALQEIQVLRGQLTRRIAPVAPDLGQDLDSHVAQHCPEDPDWCFGLEGGRQMLALQPDLIRRTADLGVLMDSYERLAPRLLSLIESQLPEAPSWHSEAIEIAAKQLDRMGFRVVRIPQIYVSQERFRWQGISYANLLAYERKLFIPTFGLGKAEEDLLRDFGRRLGREYEIVPVPARLSLLNNGGVHCVFGIVREP